ncbi:MAG: class I SAM-dependent methyltransferase [Candidatus Dormibacteria bacterium]
MIDRIGWHFSRRVLWRVLPFLGPPPALPTNHPDGHLRHQRIAAVIRGDFPAGTVLNVGDPLFSLRDFLPAHDVTSTDLGEPVVPVPAEVTFVRADFTSTNAFTDGSYELVVSTDVLEHVSPERRADFLLRSARVARRAVYHAFPAGEAAAEAEGLIRASRTRRNYRAALEEHARHGLPVVDSVASTLEQAGMQVRVAALSSVTEWLASFVFDAHDHEDPGLVRAYFDFLNRGATDTPGAGPVYRWLVSAHHPAPLS